MAVSVVYETHSITVDNEAGLRECDYGSRTGMPVSELHAGRADHLDRPYPGGESWRQAVTRVRWFCNDLVRWCDGSRVLVIGHVATRWGLDHYLRAVPLEDLAGAEFAWQPGWEYELAAGAQLPG